MNKKAREKGFREFNKALREDDIPEVLLLYGTEDYLLDWAVGSIVSKYVDPAVSSLDKVTIDWKAGMDEEIISSCETFPMLSPRRVIHVRDKDLKSSKGEDLLVEYLDAPASHSVLIFTAEAVASGNALVSKLKKSGAYYCFDTLEGKDLRSFVNKRFRQAGASITGRQVHLITDLTGYGNRESDYKLYNLVNDIQKILAHSGGSEIRDEDITASVVGDQDTFIFNLLDGISANNKGKAFELINNFLTRDQYQYPAIIGQIVSHMELMYDIRQLLDDPAEPSDGSGIAARLKKSPYRVGKLMRFVRNYDMEKMTSLLLSAYGLNRDILTGRMEGRTALELFVADI